MRCIVLLWIFLAASSPSGVPGRSGGESDPGAVPPVILPGGPLLFGDAAPGAARGFGPGAPEPAGGGHDAVPDLWQLIQLPGEDPESFMKPGATMTGMQMGVRLLSSDAACDEETMPGRPRPAAPKGDCAFDPGDDRVLPASCR